LLLTFYYLHQGGFSCRLSACLSICLLATLHKTADQIFTKILQQDKELTKYWMSVSGSESRNF